LKKKILDIAKALIFLALGIFLFWLVYRGQDIDRIKSVLKNDVNYRWIWFSLFLGLLSHISRTLRWVILIKPLGKKPRKLNTFFAVMIGYLMNLALPRLGEVSRCGALSKYENISMSKLLGTVVLERFVDVIMLLLLTLFVFVTQFDKMLLFLHHNPEVEDKVLAVLTSPVLIGAVIFGIAALIIFRKKYGHLPAAKKFNEVLSNFGEGFRSFKTMDNKLAFVFHTVFIWAMYFLMSYVSFQAFGFTSGLPILAGMTVFVLGSYGMVAPVQGGIGAWHVMTIEGLALYGVAKSNGVIFAFLVHAAQTSMMLIVGLISLWALPFINRRRA